MTTPLDIRRPSPAVAEIRPNRPDVRNALNAEVIAELAAAFTTLVVPGELRVIDLGGHGEACFLGKREPNWR